MPTVHSEAPAVSLRPAHTPSLPLGPFYPVLRSAPGSAAMWLTAERPATARPLVLQGRVLDAGGHPLRGAQVEVWHADHLGRYRHPSQPGLDGIEAGFAGYGVQITDGQGAWRIASVLPGCYGAESHRRAPHVHFQVTLGANRLVTQMFFAGHALNQADRWYRAVDRPEGLLGRVIDDSALRLTVGWDIVMACAGGVAPAPPEPIEEPR